MSGRKMAENTAHLGVRIEERLHKWIQAKAIREQRSMAGQISYMIQEAMEREEKEGEDNSK